jgi:peptide/nickel transport system substrate-binding protein/oligopeptide transport system substrate-binding protein
MRPIHLMGLLLLATVAGCGEGGRSDTALHYYLTADPVTLDPALSTDVQSGEVVATIFDNLVQFDVDGRLVPGLASRWEADSTGLRYTFHLRGGVTFSDGRPLTARDVEASIKRALAPGSRGRQWPLEPIAGARAYADGKAQTIAGLAVPDDSTVIFTLDHPLNIFPKFLAMPVAAVVPAPTPADFSQHPMGSGPWKLVSWSHDNLLVLARNDRHWGEQARSETLTIRIIPETATQAADFETGNLSVLEVPYSETQRWESSAADRIKRRPAIRNWYVAINTTRGPLKDVRVRRALNMAVDVETILKTILAGRGIHAAGAIPPGIDGYDENRKPYPYNPDSARALLKAAGYGDGFSLKLWRSQRTEFARVAQAIQQGLAAVGIKVEIVERDATSVRAAVRAGETDLYLGDWYADYPDPENFTYPLFNSVNRGPGGNYARLDDPIIDSLTTRLRVTLDEGEKAQLAREADQRIFDLAPWIFLWFPEDMWVTQPGLTGWQPPAVFTGQRWVDAHIGQ